MRVEFAVALVASTALHAILIFYPPPDAGSRNEAMSATSNPGVVIVAHLKNTLDEAQPARRLSKAPENRGRASGDRKPHLDNPLRFYPPEAIARGIEGETILMLRYRPDGTLLDAKIARSSGHAILDQAALRAVRATQRTSDGAREILFPVTFALQ
jgi:TonB family protein